MAICLLPEIVVDDVTLETGQWTPSGRSIMADWFNYYATFRLIYNMHGKFSFEFGECSSSPDHSSPSESKPHCSEAPGI